MAVAEYPAVRAGLRPNTYAGALFVHNFQRKQAYRAVKHLHIHSTLRKDEWDQLDSVVTTRGREVLVGVQDLRGAAGILQSVSIAVSIAQYNRQSEMGPADVAMNPLADGTRGRLDYGLAGVPIPFVFKDFQLDIRTLTASRILGPGLDVSQGSSASYVVSQQFETMLFRGTPAIAVADRVGTLNTIYGYTTHPDRNTGISVGDWGDTTSGYIYAINTIEAMKRALRDDRYMAPYWLYVNSHNWSDINSVNAQTDRRVIDVIRADPEITKVMYTPQLLSGELVMVAPRPEVVRWVEAAAILPVEWDEKGGLGTNYRVIGAAAPLVKSTDTGQSGIAHWTQAT